MSLGDCQFEAIWLGLWPCCAKSLALQALSGACLRLFMMLCLCGVCSLSTTAANTQIFHSPGEWEMGEEKKIILLSLCFVGACENCHFYCSSHGHLGIAYTHTFQPASPCIFLTGWSRDRQVKCRLCLQVLAHFVYCIFFYADGHGLVVVLLVSF